MSNSPLIDDAANYAVPDELFQPLWFRYRESIDLHGLVYDPVAARACQRCRLSPQCTAGNLDKQQRLYASITSTCDQQISQFLSRYPDAWIINLEGGLDTRFYRLDNGRCHWIEVDKTSSLEWRNQLFHTSERFQFLVGGIKDLNWVQSLPYTGETPVLIVCESALLRSNETMITRLLQSISLRLPHAYACLVLAGQRTQGKIGQALGCGIYQHQLSSIPAFLNDVIPSVSQMTQISPLNQTCRRWSLWQRELGRCHSIAIHYTPNIVFLGW